MEKLKKVIEEYGRWTDLSIFIGRIETYIDSDFSQALENAKAMLETIGKEICKSKGIEVEATASINSIIKKAFEAIGYSNNNLVNQISRSLANIGQEMGNLRNEIGLTSHGMSLEELRERNNKVDILTKEYLIDSTVIVSCLLIRSFESKTTHASKTHTDTTKMLLSEQEDFNNLWDDTYGEFLIGSYSFSASEILYYVDYDAYKAEYDTYISEKENEEKNNKGDY